MSLSISPVGSYGSMAAIEPINYSIKNNSKVSDSYEDSLKQVKSTSPFGSIDSTAPVLYPNAQIVDPAKQVKEASESAKAYNQLASSFQGMTTGYNNRQSAQSYSQNLVGSNFDAFA